MDIDKNRCVGCGNCHAICPMGAISMDVDGKSIVNQDECVECSTCHRVLRDEGYAPSLVGTVRSILSALSLQFMAEVDVCPTNALVPPELEYPRSIRAAFSDPTVVHAGTGVGGRGTGEAGIVIELGRPGTGAHFKDVEKIATSLIPLEPHFETNNPVTQLMEDPSTGKIREEVLGEKVLSAIIEVKTTLEKIPEYLRTLESVQWEIDTVFAVGVASKCDPDGSAPHQKWVQEAGYILSPNGKTNLGLGRPLFQEAEQ